MHAVVQHRFGEPAEVLAVEEIALPEPGPKEVRLRVLLSPVHNHDLWTAKGSYGFVPELPARAGTELVGIVDAVGARVQGVEVGSRVATAGAFGAWAEYVVTKPSGLVPVGAEVADEQAAQLVAMPFSAIALLDSLGLESGDVLVQNAANGAVGRMLAQLGPARGVRVISLVRRAAGVEELAEVGITDAVATDAEGWQQRVTELLGGHRPVVGIDSVGGQASGELAELLAPGGRLIVFGSMHSPVLKIVASSIIFNDVSVHGFWGSRVIAQLAPEKRAALFGELFARLADGTLQLPVERIYPLEQITEAVDANAVAGRRGKVLLRP